MKKAITLNYLQHRQQSWIAVYFKTDISLNNQLKKITGCQWSRSHQCWLLPFCQTNLLQLQKQLTPFATLNIDALQQYFKTGSPLAPKITAAKNSIPNQLKSFSKIHAVNKEVLAQMRQHLILKGYSPSTIKTYINEMGLFLQAISNHPASGFTANRIKDYLQYCYEKLNYTENTLHSRMNALKFYYEQVLNRAQIFWEIPRPKKRILLPKVISEEKLLQGLLSVKNIKHKALLFTAYSAGLRVSEVIALKITDIDSDRMQIKITNGKGKKDRMATLAKATLEILREYFAIEKPKKWLFEGQNTDAH
ncbi:MAG: hypothetical protein RLZZ316_2173, partial [Bacteroidota bacterium]